MYTVDVYRRVRRAHFVEGMSIRQAARMFNLHCNTVNKMLEYSAPPGYRREQPPRRPKLDPYKGVIDRRRTINRYRRSSGTRPGVSMTGWETSTGFWASTR